MNGVSIVICCHNSRQRLPETLKHIALQQVPPEVDWELILVDNASTDGTAQAALSLWQKDAPVPLRLVHEPQPGLVFARTRGFAAARFDLVSFVDDDNWLNSDWVETVALVMAHHPTAGAYGGQSEAICEIAPPFWFDQNQENYAVGRQAEEAGDVTWTRGSLWGAGLTIRKSAWLQLIQNGYKPLLAGRSGKLLISGSDTELCCALRLAGWQLRYDPRLVLKHFLPSNRLQWKYLRRLNRGFGAASISIDPYHFATNTSLDGLEGRSGRVWTWQARRTASELWSQHRLTWLASLTSDDEGNAETLKLERLLGRLTELLRKRAAYDESYRSIWQAKWRRPFPAQITSVDPVDSIEQPDTPRKI